jgi:uncharacterized protein YbjT (DUF2867 family)
MILVAGGNGTLGRLLVPLLTAQGDRVRILSRGPGAGTSMSPAVPGVELVTGDVRDAASVDRAMAGVTTLVSAINGFGGRDALGVRAIDRDGNATLIDAAVRACVGHVVLISIQGASANHPIELFRMKAEAEAHLRASGLSWTIVRPTAYQETWLEIVGRPLVETGRTRIFGRGENLINFVSAEDVARIAALAVADPTLRAATLDVSGPQNLSFDAFVAVVRSATGATGTVSHTPLPMLRVMSTLLRPFKPVLAGQMAAAIVMDTRDMTADTADRARRFPTIASTPLIDVATRRLGVVAERPTLRPSSSSTAP